jgi:hypothetical protein
MYGQNHDSKKGNGILRSASPTNHYHNSVKLSVRKKTAQDGYVNAVRDHRGWPGEVKSTAGQFS